MTRNELIFLGACILLRDPDDQFFRRDSVAAEAADKAFAASEFLWNRLLEKEPVSR